MIKSLPLFHQVTGQTILVMGNGEAAEAKRRLVERAGGVVADDVDAARQAGCRIAFVALDQREECESVAGELRAAGMLVNVPDQPDLCDFTIPSILDRDPVLIAIGTGGASAGLAKHIRLRLEHILPQTLGNLANALFAVRAQLRERFPSPTNRRRAIDEALREGGMLDPMRADAAEHVTRWLDGGIEAGRAHTQSITLTSRDPDDLTIGQARLLGEADRIVAPDTVPDTIMTRARADAQRLTPDAYDAATEVSGLTVIIRADFGD